MLGRHFFVMGAGGPVPAFSTAWGDCVRYALGPRVSKASTGIRKAMPDPGSAS